MAAEMQAKLLNVIEDKTVRRVGGTREHSVEVRIIAATNRDLPQAIDSGEFRSDLYYRLKVVHLRLPPLRDRGTDLDLLAEHFFEIHRKKYRKPHIRLDSSSMDWLRARDWPGNVRELAHTLEQMVLMSTDSTLPRPSFGTHPSVEESSSVGPAPRFDFSNADCTLETVEKSLIREALAHTGGNVSEVSRLLGMTRGALRHRMDKWGIRP